MFDLRQLARDSLYVAVGFGVLGFQRAQVARRDLEKRLGPFVPEPGGLAKEAVAFGRFALQVLRAPATRRSYP
jgi:hypothetical protein